ncbi:ribonuclease III [Salinisphaera orenii]|uniref:ribonuclease III n=1 Tax=Salinisphaera orenii TaxID=856731 RepID=UPI00296FA8D3
MSALETRLNYEFADRRHLKRALTHRSAGPDNNERLEFLGDGVLNFVIAAELFERLPDAPEGDLSRLRATLVNEPTLAEIADEIGVAELLTLGPSETGDGSRRRDSVRADTVEAVIGAVYIDSGFDATRDLISRLYTDRLEQLPSADDTKDAKTRLQEWLQARGRQRPHYELVRTEGAEHCRTFVAYCRLVDSDVGAEGQGSSRRKAEQVAAMTVLERVRRASSE